MRSRVEGPAVCSQLRRTLFRNKTSIYANPKNAIAAILTTAAMFALLLPPAHAQALTARSSSDSAVSSTGARSTPAPPNRTEAPFVILLDPAHGGADNGAMLAPNQPEKAYTLALALRLQALLKTQGIPAILTRTSDVTLDSTARAEIANRAHPAACLLLHATSTGIGIHLFTSSLPPVGEQIASSPRRGFLPWGTAQASFESASLRLESDVNTALAHAHLSVLITRSSMVALNSFACPAVAFEIAPRDPETPVSDPAYERQVTEALASGLTAWYGEWKGRP